MMVTAGGSSLTEAAAQTPTGSGSSASTVNACTELASRIAARLNMLLSEPDEQALAELETVAAVASSHSSSSAAFGSNSSSNSTSTPRFAHTLDPRTPVIASSSSASTSNLLLPIHKRRNEVLDQFIADLHGVLLSMPKKVVQFSDDSFKTFQELNSSFADELLNQMRKSPRSEVRSHFDFKTVP
jgi:hypothetical protein